MNKLHRLCAMAAMLLVVSAIALAQDGGTRGRRGRMQRQMSIQDAVRQLELTAEQKKKVAPTLKEDTEARGKLRQELMQTFRDQDEKARAEVQEKIKALDTKTKKQLAKVLTKEQMAKVERITGPGGAFDRFVALVNKLDLTAGQKTKVPAVVKAADTDAGAKGSDAAKVYQEATTKINDLLTDEQKTKLRRLRQAEQLQYRIDRMLANVTLTEGQKSKVQKLVEKAQKDSAEAGDRAAQREIMQKLMENIRNDVLTEEQRGKLPTMPGGRRRGGA
ncbi:MAG TPA: hypothetical protein VMZ50_13530 [Phycisphaerae bacterium]|nr:hypothetical protein [Phycisphaerae bacterium]